MKLIRRNNNMKYSKRVLEVIISLYGEEMIAEIHEEDSLKNYERAEKLLDEINERTEELYTLTRAYKANWTIPKETLDALENKEVFISMGPERSKVKGKFLFVSVQDFTPTILVEVEKDTNVMIPVSEVKELFRISHDFDGTSTVVLVYPEGRQ